MKPEEVMASIEREAPSRGLPIIGPQRGVFLDQVMEEHRPARVLEVGTLVGYSAIRIARHMKKGQKLVCVELRDDMARVARSNIERAGLSEFVEVMVGDAKSVLPRLDGTFDMVFLDAAKDEYLGYLKSVESMLRPGSVIVADNVKSHSAELAGYLAYVRNPARYKSEYKEVPSNFRYGRGTSEPDAVEVSVKL